jgi:hypothetical protein
VTAKGVVGSEGRRRVGGDEGVEAVRDRREEVSLMLRTITVEEKVEAGGASETVQLSLMRGGCAAEETDDDHKVVAGG